MAVREGNDVLDGTRKTIASNSPRPEGKKISNSSPRQNTYTILPDGIMISNELDIHQKLMLCYLLRQAAYLRTIREIPVSTSKMLEHIGTMRRNNVFKTQQALITKGYIEKVISTTENGNITKYKLNLKKIENDFNFEFKEIFCKIIKREEQ